MSAKSKSTNDFFFAFPSVKFHKIWQTSLSCDDAIIFQNYKLPILLKFSVVTSNIRASNNLTFYNVEAQEGPSFEFPSLCVAVA